MTPKSKKLLTLELSITYQPASLPSWGQKNLNNSFEVQRNIQGCSFIMHYWLTKIINFLAKVSTRFYLGLYIRGSSFEWSLYLTSVVFGISLTSRTFEWSSHSMWHPSSFTFLKILLKFIKNYLLISSWT